MPSDPETVAADHVTIDNFIDPDDGGTNSDWVCIGAGLNDPDAIIDAAVRAGEIGSVEIADSGARETMHDLLPVDGEIVGGDPRFAVCGTSPTAAREELSRIVRLMDGRKIVVLTDWLVYCDNLASLSSWVDELLEDEAAVSAVGSDVVLDPNNPVGANEVAILLGELSTAELDPRDIPDIEVLRKDWSGRTPVGTKVSLAGNLVPSTDWDRVRKHLLDVVEGEASQRFAAKRIGCSERTVARILNDPERRELYRLPVKGTGGE